MTYLWELEHSNVCICEIFYKQGTDVLHVQYG